MVGKMFCCHWKRENRRILFGPKRNGNAKNDILGIYTSECIRRSALKFRVSIESYLYLSLEEMLRSTDITQSKLDRMFIQMVKAYI